MSNAVREKLQKAIAYFEQIRQMMPDDRLTLEFLCVAYEQLDDRKNFQQVLADLVKVLVRERDFASAQALLERLESHDEPEIKAAELKIRAMLAPEIGVSALKKAEPDSRGQAPAGHLGRSAAIAAECALMRRCVSARLVEKDVADRVCGELKELETVPGEFLISALAILENENSGLCEAVVAGLADETRTVPIAIEAFEQTAQLIREIPAHLVRVRGVVPFGRIADETLVAVANPADENLRQEVSVCFGGRCRFFLAPPQSLALVLGRLHPEGEK